MDKQSEAVFRERDALLQLDNPLILNLHYSFQTDNRLYFVLDLVEGGDLFGQLEKKKHLSENAARFYGAEIVLALKHIHEKGILYRDLKPENILLDA